MASGDNIETIEVVESLGMNSAKSNAVISETSVDDEGKWPRTRIHSIIGFTDIAVK